MIRTTLLLVYVAALVWYARRDWFVSLCGAILLMAVVQHPDMPRNVAAIQGFNPWNILIFSVTVCWLLQRKRQGHVWDMPRHVTALLILYGGVVSVAFFRMIVDRRNLTDTPAFLISEHFINCAKWVVPGLILYDACRTRRRVLIATAAILGIYFLLAVQVIRWMPLDFAMTGNDLSYRASKILQNEVGYNRVNMSMLLAGGSWAIVAASLFFRRWQYTFAAIACAAIVAVGQALTGGRTGYATWAVVGLIFGVLRWRRVLPLIPIAAALVLTMLPGVSERLLQGFGGRQGAIEVASDQYEITSGRNLIWPYVIEEIKKAPVFGYGRLAMNRLGIAQFLMKELGEEFPHPHNAYLELLLDNGVVGLVLVLPFYIVVLWRAAILFCNRTDDFAAATGGVTLALVLALLIAAVGSQTFYPREGAVGMWAAIGIMMRVSEERKKGRENPLLLPTRTSQAFAGDRGRPRPGTDIPPRLQFERTSPPRRGSVRWKLKPSHPPVHASSPSRLDGRDEAKKQPIHRRRA